MRLRIGARPGSARDDVAEAALGTATTTRFASSTGASAIVVARRPRGRRRAGSAGSGRCRGSRPPARASRQASVTVVAVVDEEPRERRPPRPAADDDDVSLGALEVDRHRDALQLEARAQLVLDPVAVVARHEPRVVDEDAQPRRPRRRLRRVEELEPAPALAGRARPRLLELAERAVERGRRDPGRVLREQRLDVVEQPAEAATGRARRPRPPGGR